MCTCSGCIGEGIEEPRSDLRIVTENVDIIIVWIKQQIEKAENQEVKNHLEKFLKSYQVVAQQTISEQLMDSQKSESL